MYRIWGVSLIALLLGVSTSHSSVPDWSFNATTIEACSCPMFCQCYFHGQPATHHEKSHEGHTFCQFNMAYKVNQGHYGAVKLDGLKYWITGDLGADYSQGHTDWARVTFQKGTPQDQRDAIVAILGHVFPVKWNAFDTAEGDIDLWEADKDQAHATLDGGKTAEVKLKRYPGNTSDPIVMTNLRYFGAPRNTGFIMMPNEVEAYRTGAHAFEFNGTNGFMVTIDMNSSDVK
jgi:hypothetical protein